VGALGNEGAGDATTGDPDGDEAGEGLELPEAAGGEPALVAFDDGAALDVDDAFLNRVSRYTTPKTITMPINTNVSMVSDNGERRTRGNEAWSDGDGTSALGDSEICVDTSRGVVGGRCDVETP
jgi:hypothetical protein